MSAAPEAPSVQWRNWRTLLVPLVTVAVVFVLVRNVAGTREFSDALANVHWALLPIPLGLVTFNLFVQVVRWRAILGAMDHPLSTRTGLFAVFATYPLAVLVPSRGGDFLRAMAVRPAIPTFEAAGSVLAEKVIDLQTLCMLVVAGTALQGRWGWMALASAALVCLWLGVWVLVRLEARIVRLRWLSRFEDKIHMVLRAFRALLERPRAFLVATLASVVAWIVVLLLIGTLLEMTDAGVSWESVVMLWPIATFVGIIPITTAGMGTRDGAFLYLLGYSAGGGASAPVLVATLLYTLVASWLFAILGIPFLVRLLGRRPAEA